MKRPSHHIAVFFIVLAHFLGEIDVKPLQQTTASAGFPKKLWLYWDSYQGDISIAPTFHQLCIERMNQLIEGTEWTLNIVSESTLSSHIQNFTYYEDVLSRSESPNPAHKADLIRLLILEKNGGVWLDASTILLEGGLASIQEYFTETPDSQKDLQTQTNRQTDVLLFYNRIYQSAEIEPNLSKLTIHERSSKFDQIFGFQNWFIACRPHAELITEWREKYADFYTSTFDSIIHELSSEGTFDTLGHVSYLMQHMALYQVIYRKQRQLDYKSGFSSPLNRKTAYEYYKLEGIDCIVGPLLFTMKAQKFQVLMQVRHLTQANSTVFQQLYLNDSGTVTKPMFFMKFVNQHWRWANQVIEKWSEKVANSYQKQVNIEPTQVNPQVCQKFSSKRIVSLKDVDLVEGSVIHELLIKENQKRSNSIGCVPRAHYEHQRQSCIELYGRQKSSFAKQSYFEALDWSYIRLAYLFQNLDYLYASILYDLYKFVRLLPFILLSTLVLYLVILQRNLVIKLVHRWFGGSFVRFFFQDQISIDQTLVSHSDLGSWGNAVIEAIATNLSPLIVTFLVLAADIYWLLEWKEYSWKVDFESHVFLYNQTLFKIITFLISRAITQAIFTSSLYRDAAPFGNQQKASVHRYQAIYFAFNSIIDTVTVYHCTKSFFILFQHDTASLYAKTLMVSFIRHFISRLMSTSNFRLIEPNGLWQTLLKLMNNARKLQLWTVLAFCGFLIALPQLRYLLPFQRTSFMQITVNIGVLYAFFVLGAHICIIFDMKIDHRKPYPKAISLAATLSVLLFISAVIQTQILRIDDFRRQKEMLIEVVIVMVMLEQSYWMTSSADSNMTQRPEYFNFVTAIVLLVVGSWFETIFYLVDSDSRQTLYDSGVRQLHFCLYIVTVILAVRYWVSKLIKQLEANKTRKGLDLMLTQEDKQTWIWRLIQWL